MWYVALRSWLFATLCNSFFWYHRRCSLSLTFLPRSSLIAFSSLSLLFYLQVTLWRRYRLPSTICRNRVDAPVVHLVVHLCPRQRRRFIAINFCHFWFDYFSILYSIIQLRDNFSFCNEKNKLFLINDKSIMNFELEICYYLRKPRNIEYLKLMFLSRQLCTR